VIVSTKNSVYSLIARADGTFEVSGGWFEREGEGTVTVEILGCTAGGHALFTDHIAAPGLLCAESRWREQLSDRAGSCAVGMNHPGGWVFSSENPYW